MIKYVNGRSISDPMNVKVRSHLGEASEDLTGYVKPIARKNKNCGYMQLQTITYQKKCLSIVIFATQAFQLLKSLSNFCNKKSKEGKIKNISRRIFLFKVLLLPRFSIKNAYPVFRFFIHYVHNLVFFLVFLA